MSYQTQSTVLGAPKLKEPKMYAVIMHNDDVTTMDFVVEVLQKVFNKSPHESAVIMMSVHRGGKGVAGVYTYDLAVTKKRQADLMSRQRRFPLKLTVEEASVGS
ncbi:MAG: ATP-dependent Clp protease adaptor ClpS [Clostridiales bacterium]|jgi:ATP-dependent Clp protease adaptor protein ClpS|nr:ATP-dependent Clp protease adaptor ClpS [Clostridiales bacterium]